MTNHPNRSRKLLNEIEFAQLKSLINEGGHAPAARIGERLATGPQRVAAWIARCPAYQGYEIGEREMAAIRLICLHGIKLSHADYLKA